jgi:uncharacterized protein YaiI (UPF0178 family)
MMTTLVGLVGWRGMVGSVLMERMTAERDFDLIEPLFFSTSNAGGAAPAQAKNEKALQNAFDIEQLKRCDIVITADIPLASRCVKAGAEVMAPNGKPFTEASIGMALAVRNLMTDLRSSGEQTSGPKSFDPRDRSTFLSTLDQTIRRIQRRVAEQPTPDRS